MKNSNNMAGKLREETVVLEAVEITDIDYSRYGTLYNMSGEGMDTGNVAYACGEGWEDRSTTSQIMDTFTRLGRTWSTRQPFTAGEMERHEDTQEIQLPTDQPIIFCMADSKGEKPEISEVVPVILRPGYMFVIKRGIWHTASHGMEHDGYYYWMSNADGPAPWQEIVGGPAYIEVKCGEETV